MFSTERESLSYATSRLVLHKAPSSRFCPVSPRVKNWLIHRLTATSPASALKSSHEGRSWNSRAPRSVLSQLEVDAAFHCCIACLGRLFGGNHPTRRRAADSCSHAGYCDRHARRVPGRGGTASYASD